MADASGPCTRWLASGITIGRRWKGWRPCWMADPSGQYSLGSWGWFTVSIQRQIRRG